jgi:integrase
MSPATVVRNTSPVNPPEHEPRARGTGRLFQRGATWHCQFYLHGRQVRLSTGEVDQAKAERFLRRRIAEAEAGQRQPSRTLKYENLRESFYADYVSNRRKSLRYKNGLPHSDKVARLDTFFAGMKATEIDSDLVRRFVIGEQKRGLSDASINRSLACLSKMFSLAIETGKLQYAPKIKSLREHNTRTGFFSREGYDRLFAELPDYFRLPYAIAYFTGMRKSEILGLDWSQVDFLNGVIRLREGETKNDEARTAPIVPELRTLLIEQHRNRQPECKYVCYRVNYKGLAVKIDRCRRVWLSACRRAGLTGMLFHDLRRSGVRNLIRAGVRESVAMEISGHKTRRVFERYNITSECDVMDAGQRLAEYHNIESEKRTVYKTGTVAEMRPANLTN